MATVVFNCGWCSSENQTAEVVYRSWHNVPTSYGRETEKRPYIVAVCRRCDRATSLFWHCSTSPPAKLEKYKTAVQPGISDAIFTHNGDITGAFRLRSNQSPEAIRHISDEIPKSVREACLDADGARSPRAKCQAFRSAVEFALREAQITDEPGATLGRILSQARDTYAISEPLIELCDNIKAFGNWGLHWRETDITENDSDNAEAITYAILDYLFVLPARVQRARASTDAAQQAHRGEGE